MEFVGISVPDEVVEAILSQPAYEGRKGSKAALVKEYVEQFLAQGLQPPKMEEPTPPTLDDACEVILSQLEPEHQRLLRQLALETGRPVAAFVISPILLARDNGTFQVLLGQWMDSQPAQGRITMRTTALTCEYCHKTIEAPRRHDQRFCNEPEDGDSCGRKWNIEQLRAKRDPKVVEATYGPQRMVGA